MHPNLLNIIIRDNIINNGITNSNLPFSEIESIDLDVNDGDIHKYKFEFLTDMDNKTKERTAEENYKR